VGRHDDFLQGYGSKKPRYNLGTQLGERGELTEAKVALERAIRIRPDSSLAHNQLANIYLLTNQPQPAEDHYRLAVEYDSENAEALFNLSNILMSQGRSAARAVYTGCPSIPGGTKTVGTTTTGALIQALRFSRL
jgi:tetratricopeptide (TPR) repeat protein